MSYITLPSFLSLLPRTPLRELAILRSRGAERRLFRREGYVFFGYEICVILKKFSILKKKKKKVVISDKCLLNVTRDGHLGRGLGFGRGLHFRRPGTT